jgi:hypothetical protein
MRKVAIIGAGKDTARTASDVAADSSWCCAGLSPCELFEANG